LSNVITPVLKYRYYIYVRSNDLNRDVRLTTTQSSCLICLSITKIEYKLFSYIIIVRKQYNLYAHTVIIRYCLVFDIILFSHRIYRQLSFRPNDTIAVLWSCTMEFSGSRNLVKDLDLTLQPRIAPRYKTWLPLATQQVSHKLMLTLKKISQKQFITYILLKIFSYGSED